MKLYPILHPKEKKKILGNLWKLARNEGCKAWRRKRKNDEKGRTTREREKKREEASFRGQFVHNVNCRNYYDIIIHPNCTGNRHAKCLIASSGGGKGAEDGIGGQRVERRRGRRRGERKVHAIKLIATTLEYNDNPGYTATFHDSTRRIFVIFPSGFGSEGGTNLWAESTNSSQ